MEIKKNYINGEWVDAASGKTRKIINPATQEVIAEVANGSVEDTQRAIAAAKESFYGAGEWRRMSPIARAHVLNQVADEMEKITDELCLLESMNTGMTVANAQGNIGMAIGTFRYYASLIQAPEGEVNPMEMGEAIQSITVREPIGVCALIAPWNVPALMGAWKMAPSLAAGNSIVFKPASLTPLTAIRIFEIFDKVGFPRGVVNLVMGSGATVGQELAESVDVDMITMTGSTEVGQDIARTAAVNMKRVGLELGGKSPAIVFADANIDSAAQWVMETCFTNQGANCCAGSRVFVEESVHDEFLKILIEKTERMTVGIGTNNPDIGAVVSRGQLDTILGYIESGKAEGAKCVAGGYAVSDGECANGFFVRPTVFDACTPDMKIVREEIFGPVATIQTFKTEEEAIVKGNDTRYGLAGGVFTENASKAYRVAKEIRAGIVWINMFNWAFNHAPWGGYKMSGQGRELGIYGLEEFQEVKAIHMWMNTGDPGLH
ncbi:aldehyde dehydrogenase family protein [Eubacterium barkeri]|uniref:Betaine-aldehyde dehydrogenase n=1 Tax=Eubacterium barkeri TaxID=1528 RepID=A0A1H3FB87_EUBBA|nr:aldehyde dehydrogenase family protein [Eubacterium barkeri]SDX87464.1 betaine-aldehyde dehydrogenase [Eubacterium barkeri]